MAFTRFRFSKSWRNSADFPRVQTSEVQVRDDMQLLHDESCDAVNGLMDALEAKASAASLGAVDPATSVATTVQTVLAQLHSRLSSALALSGNAPVGGTTGQVLAKSSNSDFDMEWKGIAALGAAQTGTYTATIGTSWTTSGSYFYQDISVPGILATDEPIVDIAPDEDNAVTIGYADAFSSVVRVVTSANKIRVWSAKKLTDAIPVRLKVVR